MNDRQKLELIAKEYEKLLIRIQNGGERQMKLLYKQLYSELTLMLDALQVSDLNILKGAVLSIQKKFNKTVTSAIYSRVDYIQVLAYKKYEALLPIMLNVGLSKKTYQKAISLYSRKIPTKINKQYISNRIWNINKVYFDQIKNELNKGLLSGTSAKDLAKRLKGFINSPLPQGKGIYRNVEKNAYRLTRTEIKRAYQLQEHEQIKALPFVKGVRVNLSAQHPLPDMCDDLQGVYPPDFQFGGWHPNCICYTTIEIANEDETAKIIQEGGQTKTEKMPQNYFDYLDKHKERYLEKPPLFLSENKELSERFFK